MKSYSWFPQRNGDFPGAEGTRWPSRSWPFFIEPLARFRRKAPAANRNSVFTFPIAFEIAFLFQ